MARNDTPQSLRATNRAIADRLARLERLPDSLHVGSWTFTEDDDGNLVATSEGGVSTVIGAVDP